MVTAAALLAAQGTPLAAQVPTVTSVWLAEMPADLDAPGWGRVPAARVPLTPQTLALPRLAQISVSSVTVRSLNDGTRIGILLEWTDATRDVRATRPDEFRDAAAVLFPVGDALPNVCMGAPNQLTNLWHWKADWQEDFDRGFQEVPDAYPNFYKDDYPFVTGQPPFRAPADFARPEARQYFPGLAAGNPLARLTTASASPVEELLANGFGTASHKTRQQVSGHGVWEQVKQSGSGAAGGQSGRWRVLFIRPLAAQDAESSDLAGRAEVPVAFAVWNGSNQEVGARKQLSGLVSMRIQAPAVQAGGRTTGVNPVAAAVVLGVGGLLAMVTLAAVWADQRALGSRAAGPREGE